MLPQKFDLLKTPKPTAPKRFRKVNKNFDRYLEYKAVNPQPAYSEIGPPDYIDLTHGIHFKRPDAAFLAKFKTPPADEQIPEAPSLDSVVDWGEQIFWMKMPIRRRRSEGAFREGRRFPEPGESLRLFDEERHLAAEAVVKQSFVDYPHKRKTGYVVFENFVTLGQTANPSRFIRRIKEMRGDTA